MIKVKRIAILLVVFVSGGCAGHFAFQPEEAQLKFKPLPKEVKAVCDIRPFRIGRGGGLEFTCWTRLGTEYTFIHKGVN